MTQISSTPLQKKRKVIASNAPLMSLDIDIVIKICKLLQKDGFLDLFFFIQVWFRFQSPEAVTILLHNLDWSTVHQVVEPFRNLECRVFKQFLKHCLKARVRGALCYFACKKLSRGENPDHHLQILRDLSADDNLAFLAYHIFQTLYHPSTLKENASILHEKLIRHAEFRSDLMNNCTTLNGRHRKYYRFWYGPEDMFPQNGVCSFFVSGKDDHNMDPYALGCSYKEIISTSCPECVIVMVIFKIIRGF
ncbi:hypothetical protein DCAR_0623464 [Daucus carota subsp. sativus]|uniref:Uncharacterized protein n=1 Tax=Daucus carota subsp. sativus TaxID=79200 RepID=A0A175YCM5_DAUCS|nr:hypothetical protein DCAR_0623464 [Daucus carota subsp. sativus]